MATPYLDLQTLRDAVEEPAVIAEILETFRMDAGARLDTITQAGRNGQLGTVAREVHSLKGMALSVGAIPLAEVCVSLEACARQSQGADVPTLLDGLTACASATLRALEQELTKLALTAA